jgi:hypothetical protein
LFLSHAALKRELAINQKEATVRKQIVASLSAQSLD